jgi:cyclic-di-GMP-binding protein
MPYTDFLPAARPRIENLAGCEEWLARAALPDSPGGCGALATLLDEIEADPPKHAAYLQILERLRHPVTLVHTANAKRFAGKSLPLDYDESTAWLQACSMWRAMLRAYTRLLGAALSGKHPELKLSLALLFHRVIASCGELIGCSWLARRGFGADHWQVLHQTYATAEACGATHAPVPDLRTDSSPMSAYAEVLLLELAHPYGMSLREFGWARAWVRSWSRKVALRSEAPAPGAFAVDLAGKSGPGRAGSDAGASTLRFVDLARVRRSIDQLVRGLEKGAGPEALGLGSDCPPLAAQELLKTLRRTWFDSAPARQFPRRASASPLELVSGFAAIHHAIEGKPPAGGEKASSYSYGEAARLHTFRHAPGSPQENRAQGHENWETLEESDQGFRLRRGTRGMRLAHRQLVALRPAGAREFILCHVDWLTEGPDQTLTIGAHALHGVAKACAVRGADRSAPQRSDALMLPVAPGLPAALVLPAGWYQRAREIELKLGDAVRRVTLAGLLERGFDYERVKVS